MPTKVQSSPDEYGDSFGCDESDGFLTQGKKARSSRWCLIAGRSTLVLFLLFATTIAAYAITSLTLSKTEGLSSTSASLQASLQYSYVTKVTGLYGKGSWLRSLHSRDMVHVNYNRALQLHQKHAELHKHKQVIASTQLFGGRINNAYTKIGNLMEQNFVAMSSNESKWLL